jgi:lactoylglutathione lyase
VRRGDAPPSGRVAVSAARIEHVALWVRDLEGMREFYERHLGGRSGTLYHNPRTGYRSYFVSFGEGARLELMTSEALATGTSAEAPTCGWAHLALCVGGRAEVDARVRLLRAAGIRVASPPRTTGDGYDEAVVLDPEGNRVELIAG